jgi:pSer/pThr/pTyr-binding forkhead associated (FHA) protein
LAANCLLYAQKLEKQMNNGRDETIKNDLADVSRIKGTTLLTDRGLLVVLSSNFLGKTFVINKNETVIGRGDESNMDIKDPMISHKHCLISIDESGKFYIEDLGSKNSTFVNDKEVKKKMHIIYGDRIIIGDTIMRFYLEEKIDKKGR